MNWLEISGATLYFLGFITLVPWEPFIDFYAWTRKRIDGYGHVSRYIENEKWELKWKPFIGWSSLILGSIINLLWIFIKPK